MICPNCKCEYVSGVKICPDCKVDLVVTLEKKPDFLQSLDDDEVMEDTEEVLSQEFPPFMNAEPDEEMIKEILERRKMIESIPVYTSKAESLNNNRSGAFALIGCGALGCLVLLLNMLGVIKLPIDGTSLILTSSIMGLLFLAFLVSGVMCIFKVKKLAPEVEVEKEKEEKILTYIKDNIDKYKTEEGLSEEEAYLTKCARAVTDLENEFPDLEPGFAYYVIDRLAGDLLDEA